MICAGSRFKRSPDKLMADSIVYYCYYYTSDEKATHKAGISDLLWVGNGLHTPIDAFIEPFLEFNDLFGLSAKK